MTDGDGWGYGFTVRNCFLTGPNPNIRHVQLGNFFFFSLSCFVSCMTYESVIVRHTGLPLFESDTAIYRTKVGVKMVNPCEELKRFKVIGRDTLSLLLWLEYLISIYFLDRITSLVFTVVITLSPRGLIVHS